MKARQAKSLPRGMCRKLRTRHERKIAKARARPVGAANRSKVRHRNRRNMQSCYGWR